MRERRASLRALRDREFEAFVAGASGRLLHTATLLTAEPPDDNPRAYRLLSSALAHTYAHWGRVRGEDPYVRARSRLATRFARETWPRHGGGRRRSRGPAAGVLAGLPAQQRLVLVLRLFEGVAEEQTAALLGLPRERVGALCDRAVATLLHPPRDRSRPVAEPKAAAP